MFKHLSKQKQKLYKEIQHKSSKLLNSSNNMNHIQYTKRKRKTNGQFQNIDNSYETRLQRSLDNQKKTLSQTNKIKHRNNSEVMK